VSDLDRLSTWIDRYVRAWNSNDESEISALFTEDAEYFTDPYTAPWSGRAAIVAKWLQHRDQPGETSFSWQPLVVEADLCIITGETHYPQQTFSNLWVIRLDAKGRCSHFTEWWMQHPKRR
jgi:hypothetical protein